MSKEGFSMTMIAIDEIRGPLFQCRSASLDSDLGELADSIKTVGLLEPLTVRMDKDEKPELVIGSRRLKACKIAGLSMVPAIVRELSDEEALEIEGSENLNRKDLTPEDKTRLVSEWAKRGYDATGISKKVHKSYTWVVSFLPFEFKNKEMSELGKLGAESKAELKKEQDLHDATEIVANLESQETETSPAEELMQKARLATELVECHGCRLGVQKNLMKLVDGEFYCSKCAPNVHVAKINEAKLRGWKERPELRVAAMHRPVSKMDEAELVRLQGSSELRELGWNVEFQKAYYVIICRSDVSLLRERNGKREELMLFWDGEEAHKTPEEDEAVRERARQELIGQGVNAEVFARSYKAYSQSEEKRLYDELLVFVREFEKWKEPGGKAEETLE